MKGALTASLLALAGLGGCKVVSVAEDQAMRERMAAGFDAARYVDGLWERQALPYWTGKKAAISDLLPEVRRDPDAAGEARGRRAGDGSPWVFVVEGEGVVRAVEGGRRGRVIVAAPGVAEPVAIQTGPVVSGSTLRDSLPFVQFNDFANQLVYADVANALTDKAMTQVGPAARGLGVGDRVRFAGVVAVASPSDSLVLTPYSLTRSAS